MSRTGSPQHDSGRLHVLVHKVQLLVQVQLSVLHAGLLVHVLCLVQLRLGVAHAGFVRDCVQVPRILIVLKFSEVELVPLFCE